MISMKNSVSIFVILLLGLSSFGCQKDVVIEESKPKLLMEEIRYDMNERETSRRSYTYDDRGNFTSISDSHGVWNYEYEEDRVIRASLGQQVSTYAYDDNKNLSEVIKTNDGEPSGSIKYEYDVSNNLIKMITETEDKVVEATYQYNSDNQVIEALSSLDNIEHKTEFEYDKDGNCIKETNYKDDVLDTVISSVYEKDLLISQKHENPTKEMVLEIKFEYNEDKQVVKELTSYDGDPFILSVEYIYE